MQIKINWKTVSTVLALASSIAAGGYATGAVGNNIPPSGMEKRVERIEDRVNKNGEQIAIIIGYLEAKKEVK